MSLTYTELHSLKRTDVQKLCKTLGIKGANQKTNTLVDLILRHYDNGGQDIVSVKTRSNDRPNSRLLQPTASSWAKQANQNNLSKKRIVSPKRILSRSRSSPYKARSKKGASKSIKVVLAESQEEPIEITELTSTSKSTPVLRAIEESAEAINSLASSPCACTCNNSAFTQPSQSPVYPQSVFNTLAELTARIHSLPSKGETDLNMQRFYSALERTDVAVKTIMSKVEISDRVHNLSEEALVKEKDVEAIVNRLVNSRLDRIEQSFADRLKAMEDKLMARFSKKPARHSGTMDAPNSSINLKERILNKRAWSEIDISTLLSSDSINDDFFVDKDTPITSTPAATGFFKTSVPIFSPPIFSGAVSLDHHPQKRPRVDSLAISNTAAGTIECIFENPSGETTREDQTPLLMTARPAVESVRPAVSLPLAFRPGCLKPKKNNHYAVTALSSRELIVTSTPEHTTVSRRISDVVNGKPGNAISYPSFSPFERQTVESLLPPVPAGASLWISPMAPSRQPYRYRPKAKAVPAKEGVSLLLSSSSGAHIARLGSSQDMEDMENIPPMPPGPTTMFGTEKETFGRLFDDEMTPWGW